MNPSDLAAALGEVLDPELGIDVVSLGLIYNIQVDEDVVAVEMTMTTPDCPMGSTIAGMAASRLNRAAGGRQVKLDLVFEPEWNIRMASPAALRHLGLPVG
ncbi:MAG: DUF59 domain-containing protein [Dehalococcoidia bacterium]|uniref:metal-sulfur cluster assembly factor n=1 Tax=Candidatus Amarobacter glycogenicus TaxID=3140699 RepID=UPI001DCE4476|nr:DUF59 domain-containing protein [Dehalococcoidia bacterium]MBK6559975.1 DUF59 domain-containing protein [Dehalococcoidia bacterium]MBK7125580.1 DUF59 domain-containing protein [Dehalococcoidia bacterium]MBK7726482.1 DUF59 domain-containing protein [Dehalococcoidia bacterium]MBK8559153.1 DUF59 domain-containing protein [Dehalococcoidia bacterium]